MSRRYYAASLHTTLYASTTPQMAYAIVLTKNSRTFALHRLIISTLYIVSSQLSVCLFIVCLQLKADDAVECRPSHDGICREHFYSFLVEFWSKCLFDWWLLYFLFYVVCIYTIHVVCHIEYSIKITSFWFCFENVNIYLLIFSRTFGMCPNFCYGSMNLFVTQFILCTRIYIIRIFELMNRLTVIN